jgi:seryl-tRNA synthetase
MTSFDVTDGFATLGPALVRAVELLETKIRGLADDCGAQPMRFAPLVGTADLTQIDYFQNFPHLALLAAPLNTATTEVDGTVPASDLAGSTHALPSAACYSLYLHLRDAELAASRYVTTVATCFRNENAYDGLRRLHGFTMREIVCVGSVDDVRDHLAAFKPLILRFAEELGLSLGIEQASDPFFQADGARAVLQKLFPVKEEFVHDGSLAIASVNFHRNFFGERCRIRLADGTPAFSGCVAFGLERWLAALLDTHGQDPERIVEVLSRVVQPAGATS